MDWERKEPDNQQPTEQQRLNEIATANKQITLC